MDYNATIDADKRRIILPEGFMIGVKSDDNVTRVNFTCPKIVGNDLDLTQSSVRINFKNAGGQSDAYIISDVTDSDDGNVTFSWLVGRKMMMYYGQAYFILCAKRTTDDGTIIQEWNTGLAKVNVLEGIEPEGIIDDEEKDIIIELLNLATEANERAEQALSSANEANENAMTASEQANKALDRANGTLTHDEYYDGLYAQGETYSGIASNKGIKLHKVVGKTTQQTTNGYQLFDASKLPTKSAGGATVTNNGDGSFTISGSGSLSSDFTNEYTIYNDEIKGLLKVGNVNLSLGSENKTTPTIQVILYRSNSESDRYFSLTSTTPKANITQEMIDNAYKLKFFVYGGNGQQIESGTLKPMLYQDGDGTWEPFTGGQPAPNQDYPMEIENVEISNIYSTAKNIVKSFTNNIATQYGVALKVDAIFKPNTTYTLKVTSKYAGLYYVNELLFTNGTWLDFSEANQTKTLVVKTRDNLDKGQQAIILKNRANNEGAVFYNVQIEEGSIATEYEKGNNATIETSLKLAEGETYIDGEPTTRKRNQVTFDGSSDENWIDIGGNTFTTPYNDIADIGYSSYNALCNRLEVISQSDLDTGSNYGVISVHNKTIKLRINESITTTEQLKTWLQTHHLTVEYQITTPTAETIKVPTIPSYNPHTNVWTDNEVPTDMEWELLSSSDNSLAVESLEKRIEALEALALSK